MSSSAKLAPTSFAANVYGATMTGDNSDVRPNYNDRYSYIMRPLLYSINVTLDGCCDHLAMPADEDLHSHAIENFARADALLFGR